MEGLSPIVGVLFLVTFALQRPDGFRQSCSRSAGGACWLFSAALCCSHPLGPIADWPFFFRSHCSWWSA